MLYTFNQMDEQYHGKFSIRSNNQRGPIIWRCGKRSFALGGAVFHPRPLQQEPAKSQRFSSRFCPIPSRQASNPGRLGDARAREKCALFPAPCRPRHGSPTPTGSINQRLLWPPPHPDASLAPALQHQSSPEPSPMQRAGAGTVVVPRRPAPFVAVRRAGRSGGTGARVPGQPLPARHIPAADIFPAALRRCLPLLLASSPPIATSHFACSCGSHQRYAQLFSFRPKCNFGQFDFGGGIDFLPLSRGGRMGAGALHSLGGREFCCL
jgi:hypothetical protein